MRTYCRYNTIQEQLKLEIGNGIEEGEIPCNLEEKVRGLNIVWQM